MSKIDEKHFDVKLAIEYIDNATTANSEEEVSRIFRTVFSLSKTNRRLIKRYALFLMRIDNYEAAAELWLALKHFDKNDIPAYAQLMNCYSVMRKFREADLLYLESARLYDIRIAYSYTRCLIGRHEYLKAEGIWRSYERWWSQKKHLRMVVDLLISLKKYNEATKYNQSEFLNGESSIAEEMEKICNTGVSHLEIGNRDYYKIGSNEPQPKSLECRKPNSAPKHYIYKETLFKRPTTNIYRIDGAYLTIDQRKKHVTYYYVFTNNFSYVDFLSAGQTPFLADPCEVDSDIASIEDRFTKFNVCHLLLDKIGRVAEFEDINNLEYLLFANSEYAIDALTSIGASRFDLESKLKGDKTITLHINRLYISDSSTTNFKHPGQFLSKNILSNLSRMSDFANDIPVGISTKKRIFIDRSNSNTRKILNVDDVDKVLKEFNFEKVKLENYEFSEQVRLFNQAQFVIGVHGAGLTNIGFCEAGSKVIELLPALCATSAFWLLANAKGLDYDAIIAIDPDNEIPHYDKWEHNVELNSKDVIVPIDQLAELIGRMI